MLQTIAWTGRSVRLLDQTQLPLRTVYIDIADEKQMWDAIQRLVVRGAPAIGVAAAFGVYLGVRDAQPEQYTARLDEVCEYLKTARLTAVNLAWAVERVRRVGRDRDPQTILNECLEMLQEDARVCRAIGEHGAKLLAEIARQSPINVLTHCNAGALATVRYGTALAPIYVGAERGMKFHVFADETRPLLQGSRITAYELQQSNIPVTVLCDSAAASVMRDGALHAVIVGADRIAANGDVANKIGTLGVAVMARHFGVPFYVAAPISTIDLSVPDGSAIPIEQRDPREVTAGLGTQTAPDGVGVINPAFDVTGAELVDAIITEKGIVRPPYSQALRKLIHST